MVNAKKTRGKKITNVQALRAFAAINVVILHVIFNAEIYDNAVVFFRFLKGWGGSGVDLFFVISGFVMVYIQWLKNKPPSAFFKDRLTRIVPNYWLFSLLIGALMMLAPKLFNKKVFSIGWLLCSLLFSSQLMGYAEPIIFVGWTIEYEMFFYLFFAISLFFNSIFKSFLTSTVLILISIFVFKMDPIMLEFTFGMIIGQLYITKNTSAQAAQKSLILGGIFFLLSILMKDSGVSRVVIYGLPSALIVFGCVNMAQMKDNIFTKIGDASYSIYLVQVFTIPAFYKFVQISNLSFLHNDFLALVCVTATILIGMFLYEIYEKRASGFRCPV